MYRSRFLSAAALSMLGVSLLAGCGDEQKADEGSEKAPSQVVARVNGTELTVHQVNFALQRSQNVTPENSKAVSARILRGLVDQEVAVQQAVADKLDRDPMVVQALDAARRQILSEAYLARKLGTPAEPSDAEISEYYDNNPEIFSERKIYQLQEVAIRTQDDKQKAAVREKLGKIDNLEQFVTWLKSEKYQYNLGQAVKAAEQLPRAILPNLAKIPKGQAVVINAPDGLLVLVVADTRAQPVAKDKAKPVIARLLTTEKRQAAIKAEVDALKAKAKVEYLGEFADAGKEEAPVAAPASEEKQPAGGEDALDKGLSGL